MKKVSFFYLWREPRSKKRRIREKWAKRKALAEIRWKYVLKTMNESFGEIYGEGIRDVVHRENPLLSHIKKSPEILGSYIQIPF